MAMKKTRQKAAKETEKKAAQKTKKPTVKKTAKKAAKSKRPIHTEKLVKTEKPAPVQSKDSESNARMWAMFCHLGGLAMIIMPFVGNIVAPLIIWLIKREDYELVDEQGKEAVNFQISMSIYGFISLLLVFAFCIGALLLLAVYIVDLIFLIIAAVKVNNGERYRYPLCIRFIK